MPVFSFSFGWKGVGAEILIVLMFGGLRRSLTAAAVRTTASRNLHQATAARLFARVSGDWRCPCGFSNFASRSMCFQCHRAKPAHLCVVGELSVGGVQQSGFRMGDWFCTCGTHNFSKREHCLSCEAQRPTAGSDNQTSSHRLLPGDWVCEKCGMHNFRSRNECLRCRWKPAAAAVTAAAASGSSAPSARTKSDGSVQQFPWTCMTCHTVNMRGTVVCEVCGAPHVVSSSSSSSSSSPSSPAARPDDWRCAQCDFLNFSSRVKCRNCGAVCASESGVMDPSLWVCECGYKNFKDREACRDCGSARVLKA